MKKITLYVSTVLLLWSCSTELSDQERMEESVRDYYFLSDSVALSVIVNDTLDVPLVQGMLATVEENLMLVGLDIDTLGTIIDSYSYEVMEEKESQPKTDEPVTTVSITELQLAKLELKYKELEAKREQYIQTRRILNHLMRDKTEDYAGFNATVMFTENGQMIEDDILLSGEFKVVD